MGAGFGSRPFCIMKPNICLYGNLGTGKSTLANYLVENHGYTKYSFADGVRKLTCEVMATLIGLNKDDVWEEYFAHQDKYTYHKGSLINLTAVHGFMVGHRNLMQGVGNGVREVIGEDAWIHSLINLINEEDKYPFVIDDCRYPNEAEEMQTKSIVVYLEKPSSDGDHPSEWCQKYIDDGFVIPDLTIPYSLGTDGAQNEINQLIK